MRLVVDAGFPQYVENFRLPDLELIRWREPSVSDLDFVRTVEREGFSGVIFLGTNVAQTEGFAAHVGALHIKVLLTHSTYPHEASMAIEHQLDEVRRVVREGGLHVIYARDVREWRPESS